MGIMRVVRQHEARAANLLLRPTRRYYADNSHENIWVSRGARYLKSCSKAVWPDGEGASDPFARCFNLPF